MTLPYLNGISDVFERYDHFILDIWGVLHDGLSPYQGVNAALQGMKDAGKQIALLSNSPNRSDVIQDSLAHDMGIPSNLYDHILTSGDSSYNELLTHQGKNIYCMWDAENPTCLDGVDIKRVDTIEEADVVLASLCPPEAKTQDYHADLAIIKECGLPMICANPDLVVNVGDDLVLCAGSIAQAYEELGGTVTWHGKPHAPIYQTLHMMMGSPDKRALCAVGDSLRTDIQGAGGFGIDAIWNLVGIHADEVTKNNQLDLNSVNQLCQQWTHTPSFFMTGLTP